MSRLGKVFGNMLCLLIRKEIYMKMFRIFFDSIIYQTFEGAGATSFGISGWTIQSYQMKKNTAFSENAALDENNVQFMNQYPF